MDEKTAALVGAAAGLTVAGRGLRPVTKVVMKGVVALTEGTADARRGVANLYYEAKAEREGRAGGIAPGSEPAPAASGERGPATARAPGRQRRA